MEGSLFAVNYWTVLAGLDMTYVSPWISLQVEATFFQLTRVRGPETQDSSRTNFTGGIHAAHFFSPAASLGAEFRVQRWISNASPVVNDPAARQQQSFGIGPRFHFKVGEKSWFRPGLSYTPVSRQAPDEQGLQHRPARPAVLVLKRWGSARAVDRDRGAAPARCIRITSGLRRREYRRSDRTGGGRTRGRTHVEGRPSQRFANGARRAA